MKKSDLYNKISEAQDSRASDGIDKIITDAIENSEDIMNVRIDLEHAISELSQAVAEVNNHDSEEPLDDELGMTKLGDRNYTLISRGVKSVGSYDPNEIFYAFEEELYIHEAHEINEFLTWVHENKKTFGHGNYEDVFQKFKKSKS